MEVEMGRWCRAEETEATDSNSGAMLCCLRVDGNNIQHGLEEIVDEEPKATQGWQERLCDVRQPRKIKADRSFEAERP